MFTNNDAFQEVHTVEPKYILEDYNFPIAWLIFI